MIWGVLHKNHALAGFGLIWRVFSRHDTQDLDHLDLDRLFCRAKTRSGVWFPGWGDMMDDTMSDVSDVSDVALAALAACLSQRFMVA